MTVCGQVDWIKGSWHHWFLNLDGISKNSIYTVGRESSTYWHRTYIYVKIILRSWNGISLSNHMLMNSVTPTYKTRHITLQGSFTFLQYSNWICLLWKNINLRARNLLCAVTYIGELSFGRFHTANQSNNLVSKYGRWPRNEFGCQTCNVWITHRKAVMHFNQPI